MIVIDTSALMAILLGEPEGERCIALIESDPDILISAATLAEAMIVADRRNIGPELRSLVEELGFDIIPVSGAGAGRVAEAYARWGRGVHRAALNVGDCFAYALAEERSAPLLFVGEDFARTDLQPA